MIYSPEKRAALLKERPRCLVSRLLESEEGREGRTIQFIERLAGGLIPKDKERDDLAKSLVSPDDNLFWHGFMQLVFAGLMSSRGLTVDVDPPPIDSGHRADIVISTPRGARALCEVSCHKDSVNNSRHIAARTGEFFKSDMSKIWDDGRRNAKKYVSQQDYYVWVLCRSGIATWSEEEAEDYIRGFVQVQFVLGPNGFLGPVETRNKLARGGLLGFDEDDSRVCENLDAVVLLSISGQHFWPQPGFRTRAYWHLVPRESNPVCLEFFADMPVQVVERDESTGKPCLAWKVSAERVEVDPWLEFKMEEITGGVSS